MPATNATLLQRFRFFREHAGYRVGYKAAGALALAKAEIALENSGADVVWEPDTDTDWSFVETWPQKEQDDFWKTDHEAETAIVVVPCPNHGPHCPHAETLGSLGGIIDADNEYRRVIGAELALESLDRLTALASAS